MIWLFIDHQLFTFFFQLRPDIVITDIVIHLNYTYLSTVFYQNTKEHFSDYLNRTRVDKAKDLLRTERASIQSIALSKKISTCVLEQFRQPFVSCVTPLRT